MPAHFQLKKIFLRAAMMGMLANCSFAATDTAPVSGFAKSFLMGGRIANATITVLETKQKFKTDKNGNFGPFQYPVGKTMTLQFKKWGYKTTQSSSVIVPAEGLTGPFDNITFQVPSIITYYALATVMGATIDKNSCHLTATVTAFHKTLSDIPQGIADVKVAISPAVTEQPFYFGVFKKGPLRDKTNPFTHKLKKTTEDGGIAYFNLPVSDKPYTLIATKPGVKFTAATFLCQKNSFINISPPRGPMVIQESES